MKRKPLILLPLLIIQLNFLTNVLNQKIHQPFPLHFDFKDADRFSNCNNCLKFQCNSSANDECELQTMFDPFQRDLVSFKLTSNVFNQSTWLAIAFNNITTMVIFSFDFS